MSSNPTISTHLTQNNHFEFSAELEDPKTGLKFSFPLEVDTGCPVELILPKYFDGRFTDFQGYLNMGGAGSGKSATYSVDIKQFGGMSLDFETMAVMTLDNNYRYGLVGMDFLKFFKTEINDQPSQKQLKLEHSHQFP